MTLDSVHVRLRADIWNGLNDKMVFHWLLLRHSAKQGGKTKTLLHESNRKLSRHLNPLSLKRFLNRHFLFAVAPICQTRWKTKSLLRKNNLARFQTEQASSSVIIQEVLNRYFNFFFCFFDKTTKQNKFDSDKEQIFIFHMQILSCERNIKFCSTSSATTTTTNNP